MSRNLSTKNKYKEVVKMNNRNIIKINHIGDIIIINNRPIVDENFVHHLCKEFIKGKSNTKIMNELGMEISNPNHTLLRDIRCGCTWVHITSQYNFDKSSKKHAYTKEQKNTIRQYILQGKSDAEIFIIMNGRAYNSSTDRLDSKYRTIYTIRIACNGVSV
jgi:hypothetical protein